MKNLIPAGRIFFAIAFIGLGIEHFIFEDFITGRAPAWPESIPGGLAWAYLTGVFFITASLAILAGKQARTAAISAGLLILIWALLRHVPVIAADSLFASTWTKAGKALTFFGGSFAIAATLPAEYQIRNTVYSKFLNRSDEFITLARICLGIFLMVTGVQHFLFTEFVASLIPAWFPGNAEFWTYFGGVTLFAGGLGLFISQTARWAALLSGIMVFFWFWIIHIPRTFFSTSDGIAVFEALAVSGICFVIAGFLYDREINLAMQSR